MTIAAIIIACVVILAILLAMCRPSKYSGGAGDVTMIVLAIIFVAFDLAVIGAVIYVAYHFITKYW